MEKLIPQNIEAEAAVLGSLLIDPDVLLTVPDLCRPDDMYRDAHREIYTAALDLQAAQTPVDLITLTDELARRGTLDQIGGASYISSLANGVPTSVNADYYASIVAQKATLRRLITYAGKVAGVAYNDAEADEALRQASTLLAEVERAYRSSERQAVPFTVAVDEARAQVTGRYDGTGRARLVLTGYGALDQHTGGLEAGELAYLAGRPGSAKSTLAAGIITRYAATLRAAGEDASGTVDWISMEMGRAQIAKRVITAVAGEDASLVRNGFVDRRSGEKHVTRYQHWITTARQVRQHLGGRIYVSDRALTVAEVRHRLERAKGERDCRLAVVDYLGLLRPEDTHAKEYQRVMDASRELKQIALDLDLTILCLVQMSRAVERRDNKRPILSDLRDAGGLEQDADWVWGIYRAYMYEQQTVRDLQHQRELLLSKHFDREHAATLEKLIDGKRHFMEVLMLKAREGVAEGTVIGLRAELEHNRVVDWPAGVDWPPDDTRGQIVDEEPSAPPNPPTEGGAWPYGERD